jgi:hypothetical protein
MIIILYLNCHGKEIKNYLLNYTKMTEIIYIPTYEYINQKKKLPYDSLKSADFIIYNPVSEEHGEYSSKEILKHLKNECKTCCIGYYRMKCFFCHPIYCNHFIYSENPKIFESPKPENINIDLVINPDKIKCNLDSKTILDEDLKKIYEIDLKSDIKMYDFIKENYKKYKLFVDPSHPTKYFFVEIFKRILNFFEIKPIKKIDELNELLTLQPYIIIPQKVIELDIKFNTNIKFLDKYDLSLSQFLYLRMNEQNIIHESYHDKIKFFLDNFNKTFL